MSAARSTGGGRRAPRCAAVLVAALLAAAPLAACSDAVPPRATGPGGTTGDGTTAPARPGSGDAARAAPLRVMAIGDSITVGFDETGTTRGGYRLGLWQRLVQHDGRAVEFVGSQHTPWGSGAVDLPHEGYGGHRIDQARAQLDWALWTYVPDVVLVHLGSNDIGQGHAVDAAAARLAELASRVCVDLPGVELVVASITSMPAVQHLVDAFNAHVPAIVANLRSWGCRARHLDMGAAVGPDELYDGVHPTSTGYDRMAAAWYPLVVRAYDGTF
jgi:lysophospholipase L1-like esterase